MAFADDTVEVFDEVLFTTLILRCKFILLICIENGTIVLMLTQLPDIIGIDTSFLVDCGTALNNSVQIPLRLVVETAIRQNSCDG